MEGQPGGLSQSQLGRKLASNDETFVPLAELNVSVTESRNSKPKTKRARRAEKTDKQKETGVIQENVAHDSTEACSTFTILRHVLTFANSMSELVLNLQEANERIEERMKVLAEDLRHLRHRLEVHITSVREHGLNLSDPALTFLDASTIQPEVLIEVMLQQTPLVPPATGPKPISFQRPIPGPLGGDHTDQ